MTGKDALDDMLRSLANFDSVQTPDVLLSLTRIQRQLIKKKYQMLRFSCARILDKIDVEFAASTCKIISSIIEDAIVIGSILASENTKKGKNKVLVPRNDENLEVEKKTKIKNMTRVRQLEIVTKYIETHPKEKIRPNLRSARIICLWAKFTEGIIMPNELPPTPGKLIAVIPSKRSINQK